MTEPHCARERDDKTWLKSLHLVAHRAQSLPRRLPSLVGFEGVADSVGIPVLREEHLGSRADLLSDGTRFSTRADGAVVEIQHDAGFRSRGEIRVTKSMRRAHHLEIVTE